MNQFLTNLVYIYFFKVQGSFLGASDNHSLIQNKDISIKSNRTSIKNKLPLDLEISEGTKKFRREENRSESSIQNKNNEIQGHSDSDTLSFEIISLDPSESFSDFSKLDQKLLKENRVENFQNNFVASDSNLSSPHYLDIQEYGFISPSDIQKDVIYQSLLELAANLIFYREKLSKFNSKFMNCWILSDLESIGSVSDSELSNKNSSTSVHIKEDQRQLLKKLIDDFLEFNSLNNNQINFEAEKKIMRRRGQRDSRLSNDLKRAMDDLFSQNVNSNKKTVIKFKSVEKRMEEHQNKKIIEFNKPNYQSIYSQLTNFLCSKNYACSNMVMIGSIFSSLNKIVTFYNQNLRANLHSFLTRLDLSFIPENKNFIKYSDFELHPNYLAYLMVDLYFSLFSENDKGNFGLYLDKLEKSNLTYVLSIISFICLNDPKVSEKILTDKALSESWKQKTKAFFSNDMLELSVLEFYTGFFNDLNEHTFNMKNSNIWKDILPKPEELQKVLDKYLLELYKIASSSLEITLNENQKN